MTPVFIWRSFTNSQVFRLFGHSVGTSLFCWVCHELKVDSYFKNMIYFFNTRQQKTDYVGNKFWQILLGSLKKFPSTIFVSCFKLYSCTSSYLNWIVGEIHGIPLIPLQFEVVVAKVDFKFGEYLDWIHFFFFVRVHNRTVLPLPKFYDKLKKLSFFWYDNWRTPVFHG